MDSDPSPNPGAAEKKTSRLFRKRFVTVSKTLIIVTMAVAAAWLVERFLVTAGGKWTEALQVGVTVVLVLVTSRYVQLTERLARGQETAIRKSTHEKAVTKSLRVTTDLQEALRTLLIQSEFLRDYFGQDSPASIARDIDPALAKVAMGAKELGHLVPELPKQQRPRGWIAEKSMSPVVWDFSRLLKALNTEVIRASAEGDAPNMELVRNWYIQHSREDGWKELIDAKESKQAWDRLETFAQSLKQYLSD